MYKVFDFGSVEREMPKRYSALTLSETLVVLVVVGVIALMMLGVFRLTDDAKYPVMRAIFKNDLATAIAEMNTEHNLARLNDDETFFNAFKQNFKISRVAVAGDFADVYKDAAGDNVVLSRYGNSFVTENGVSVAISYVDAGKDLSSYVNNVSKSDIENMSYEVSNAALNFVTGVFDLNGAKGPNKIGQDVGIIMPTYPLNKAKGEYLTFDNGNVTLKSTKYETTKKLVDADGKVTDDFKNGVKTNEISCSGNFVPDDFGSCNICGLTNASCAAKGQQLNAQACQCEYNISCPKGQILTKVDDKMVCKPINLNLDPGAHVKKDAQGNLIKDEETGFYKCEFGAGMKCSKEGGKWIPETCTCDCAALPLCDGKYEYMKRTDAGFCKCDAGKCLDKSVIDSKISGKNATSTTQYINDETQYCFSCKPAKKGVSLTRNAELGVCEAKCSNKDIDTLSNYLNNGNKYYQPREQFFKTDADGNYLKDKAGNYIQNTLPNEDNICSPKCVITDEYCAKKSSELAHNYCADTPINQKLNGFDRRLNVGCSRYPALTTRINGEPKQYTCDPKDLKFVAKKDADGKIDENACTCVLADNKDQDKVYLLAGTATKTLSAAYHGSCGWTEAWACTYKPKKDENGNIVGQKLNKTHPTDMTIIPAIIQNCITWWDPIVLIHTDNNVNTSAIPMKRETVTFAMDDKGNTSNITWLAAQNGTPVYYFLTKGDKVTSLLDLFSDAEHNNGIVELDSLYETNKDGVINKFDKNFKTLRLWADKNADAKVDTGEITTLDAMNVIEISLDVTTHVSEEGRAEANAKAVTAIQGSYIAGVHVTAKEGTYVERFGEVTTTDGVKRVLYKAVRIETQKKTVTEEKEVLETVDVYDEIQGKNVQQQKTTKKTYNKDITEEVAVDYYYVKLKGTNGYFFQQVDVNGKAIYSDNHPLAGKKFTEINRYYIKDKDNKLYKEVSRKIVDILFQGQ